MEVQASLCILSLCKTVTPCQIILQRLLHCTADTHTFIMADIVTDPVFDWNTIIHCNVIGPMCKIYTHDAFLMKMLCCYSGTIKHHIILSSGQMKWSMAGRHDTSEDRNRADKTWPSMRSKNNIWCKHNTFGEMMHGSCLLVCCVFLAWKESNKFYEKKEKECIYINKKQILPEPFLIRTIFALYKHIIPFCFLDNPSIENLHLVLGAIFKGLILGQMPNYRSYSWCRNLHWVIIVKIIYGIDIYDTVFSPIIQRWKTSWIFLQGAL